MNWVACPYCSQIPDIPIPSQLLQSGSTKDEIREIIKELNLKPAKVPLRHRGWFIILMIMFFAPLGMYFLWASPWSRQKKLVITLCWVALIGIGMATKSDESKYADARLKEARMYLREGKFDNARMALDAGLEKKPDHRSSLRLKKNFSREVSRYYLKQARTFKRKGNLKRARELARKARQADKSYKSAQRFYEGLKDL